MHNTSIIFQAVLWLVVLIAVLSLPRAVHKTARLLKIYTFLGILVVVIVSVAAIEMGLAATSLIAGKIHRNSQAAQESYGRDSDIGKERVKDR